MKLINKTKSQRSESYNAESGNVLFLILIAVALFAALSYAVTSSSRSGGGDANDETNLISSSTITQYPASVRTAIMRMQVSKGIAIEELEFNEPSEFDNCLTVGGVLGANCVFHPNGGKATFVPGSAEVMASGTQTDWIFSSANEVNLIGLTAEANAADEDTAEVIAFLPGIRKGICERINEQLGIPGVPVETAAIDFSLANSMVNTDGSTPPEIEASGSGGTIGETPAADLDGQAFGCFQEPTDDKYVYYHVILEQ